PLRGGRLRAEERGGSAVVDGATPPRGVRQVAAAAVGGLAAMLVAFNKRRYETTLMASRMLVTHALPYANGSLHLGHMVESVQTDVFVRAMNAMGTECVFICADDTHGTPIEISARKAGVAPEEWIARTQRDDAADYKALEVGVALYHRSHSAENVPHTRRSH